MVSFYPNHPLNFGDTEASYADLPEVVHYFLSLPYTLFVSIVVIIGGAYL